MEQNKRTRFAASRPGRYFLDGSDRKSLADFLKEKSWISDGETLQSVEKPGEGNMNCVWRVRTDRRSFIVKQARPWVEKYPHIDAPVERAAVEAEFYGVVGESEVLRGSVPELLDFSADDFILMVEDLGDAADCSDLYQKPGSLSRTEMDGLVGFLSGLHRLPAAQLPRHFPANRPLRELNAEHLFNYPYQEANGFDLDSVQPGLQELSLSYKRNPALKERAKDLRGVYLSRGGTLLHGDYYPGSWLRTEQGIRVIDPEFAHLGQAEFDLGVFVAHLKMARVGAGKISRAVKKYLDEGPALDEQLLAGFCGTEILRRLIGLAQLPLDLTVAEKATLLDEAVGLLLRPDSGAGLVNP